MRSVNLFCNLCLVYTHKQLLLVGMTSASGVSIVLWIFWCFVMCPFFGCVCFWSVYFVMCLFFVLSVLASVKVSFRKQLLLVGMTSAAGVSIVWWIFWCFVMYPFFGCVCFWSVYFVMCLFFVLSVLASVNVSFRQGSIYRGLMTTYRVY